MQLAHAHAVRVGALLSGLGVGDGRFSLHVHGAGEARLHLSPEGSPTVVSTLRPGFGMGARIATMAVEMAAETRQQPEVEALAHRAQRGSGRPQPARALAALRGGCWLVDRPWPPVGHRVPWPASLQMGVLVAEYSEDIRHNERGLRRARPPQPAPASLDERVRVAGWMTALMAGDLPRVVSLSQDRAWMRDVAPCLPGWLPMESAIRTCGGATLPSVSGATSLVLASDEPTLHQALEEGALRMRAHAIVAHTFPVCVAPDPGEPFEEAEER